MSAIQPILEVSRLSVTFSQYHGSKLEKSQIEVIRDFNMAIRPGEMVAVVGSSGSGKSLLAHAILDILPYNAHREGTIKYLGEELASGRIRSLRGKEISLVPQSVTYLDPLMKVGQQVSRGTGPDSRRKAAEALARYGLAAETVEQYPFELSGGMARRVLISTAVAEPPRLVVADEPTPGLHPDAARRVLNHFREIADTGAGVLLITHDLEAALLKADRVVVLYAGTAIEDAAAADFINRDSLRHPYTKALWDAMPSHGFKPLAGGQPYAGRMPGGCAFASRCPKYQPDCACGNIPYQEWRGGWARCLHLD